MKIIHNKSNNGWNDTERVVQHQPSSKSSVLIDVLSKKEVLIEVPSKTAQSPSVEVQSRKKHKVIPYASIIISHNANVVRDAPTLSVSSSVSSEVLPGR